MAARAVGFAFKQLVAEGRVASDGTRIEIAHRPYIRDEPGEFSRVEQAGRHRRAGNAGLDQSNQIVVR